MARTATGAITIVDITDGTNPISSFMSNENHTFPATTDGAVAAGDIDNYTTTIHIYEGDTEINFDIDNANDTSLANSTYRIASSSEAATPASAIEATGAGWSSLVWVVTGNGANAIITGPNTSLTGSSTDSSSLTIPIRVKNSLGSIQTFNFIVTFTKAIIGAGGDIISMEATKQFFTAGSNGTLDAGQADIIIKIDTQGAPGAQKYYTNSDGAATRSNVTNTSDGAGGIAGFNTDASDTSFSTGAITGAVVRLKIVQGNLGNSNETLSIIVTGSTDSKGKDIISIVKVRKGTTGEDALIVSIESNSNGNIFKNTDTTDKTLTVKVYDAGTGVVITTGITYDWRLGPASATAKVQVNNSQEVVQSSGSDAVAAYITIDNTDVTGAQEYSCIVTVS